jgi:hypothetical protein
MLAKFAAPSVQNVRLRCILSSIQSKFLCVNSVSPTWQTVTSIEALGRINNKKKYQERAKKIRLFWDDSKVRKTIKRTCNKMVLKVKYTSCSGFAGELAMASVENVSIFFLPYVWSVPASWGQGRSSAIRHGRPKSICTNQSALKRLSTCHANTRINLD